MANDTKAILMSMLAAWLVGCATAGKTAPPAGPRPGEKIAFTIEKASWGVKSTWSDVTEEARAQVDGRGVLELNLMKANPIFGDPVPGAWKYLRIEYRYDGAYFQEEFRENQYVILPVDPDPPRGKLEILEARFGREGAWRDVTQRLRKKIDNGKLYFNVHGSSGYLGDPAKGDEKDLVVKYSVDGKVFEATTSEKSVALLKLP